MCDMQKMPTRDDTPCDEDTDMNFAAYPAGTHFVTTGGQLPVTKLQQNVSNNGTSLSQVVGMVSGVNMAEGVQYVRTIDSSTLQAAPQLISVPIALPGVKPGDPQPTVQIQVLGPNLTLQQQQPKYQMQIPIQGFQQGGSVLTVAYSPDANESGGIQLIGNTLPDELRELYSGVQVQLCQLCSWCVCVSRVRCCIGAGSDKVLGLCVRLYSLLAAFVKQLGLPMAQIIHLERLLKLAGRKLSYVCDDLVSYVTESQNPKTVQRDTKLLPRLVREAEAFNANVMLMRHNEYQKYLSLGTARDFKINTITQKRIEELEPSITQETIDDDDAATVVLNNSHSEESDDAATVVLSKNNSDEADTLVLDDSDSEEEIGRKKRRTS